MECESLRPLYNHFNKKCFDNKLPPKIPIVLEPYDLDKQSVASVKGYPLQMIVTPLLFKDIKYLPSTFLHEMIHVLNLQEQTCLLNWDTAQGHNKYWYLERFRIFMQTGLYAGPRYYDESSLALSILTYRSTQHLVTIPNTSEYNLYNEHDAFVTV